ncbi:30S ribosomal protein S6 [bacterium]|nr:30S ribosomal protein S6 [bacterium]
MRFYELTFLTKEENLNSLSQKINSIIKEAGGEIQDNQKLPCVKRKLGYPIKKEKVAMIATLNFQIEPSKIKIIDEKLKSEPNILRYMITNKKELKIPFESPPKEVKKKVELKEIDKKLEEILKE